MMFKRCVQLSCRWWRTALHCCLPPMNSVPPHLGNSSPRRGWWPTPVAVPLTVRCRQLINDFLRKHLAAFKKPCNIINTVTTDRYYRLWKVVYALSIGTKILDLGWPSAGASPPTSRHHLGTLTWPPRATPGCDERPEAIAKHGIERAVKNKVTRRVDGQQEVGNDRPTDWPCEWMSAVLRPARQNADMSHPGQSLRLVRSGSR